MARNNLQKVVYEMNSVTLNNTNICIKDKYLNFLESVKGEVVTEVLAETIVCKREEYIDDLIDNKLDYLLKPTSDILSSSNICFTAEEWQARKELEDILQYFDSLIDKMYTKLYENYSEFKYIRYKSLVKQMEVFDNKNYDFKSVDRINFMC